MTPAPREKLLAFIKRDFVFLDEAYNILNIKTDKELEELSIYELEKVARKIIKKHAKKIHNLDLKEDEIQIYYHHPTILIRKLVDIGYFGKIDEYLKHFIDYENLRINSCYNRSPHFKYIETFDINLKDENGDCYSVTFYVK